MNLNTTARPWQIDKLTRGPAVIERILKGVSQDAASTYRDDGDGWTVLEVMGHLRDFEAIFLERAKLTVQTEDADLPFPKPDDLARENAYNRQDLRTVIAAWKANREAFLAYLSERTDDDWAREANHPTRGKFSLDAQVFLAAWHDFNHIDQLLKILGDKAM